MQRPATFSPRQARGDLEAIYSHLIAALLGFVTGIATAWWILS